MNEPSPHQAPDEPHPEAYRWMRLGEFRGDFTGLPLMDALEIYSHMVLGAPRQLLSRVRPDLIGEDETTLAAFDKYMGNIRDAGHDGEPFVAIHAVPSAGQRALLLPIGSPMVTTDRHPPGPYRLHFLLKILALAKQQHCKLVFLHVPTDEEYGDSTIPELAPAAKYGTAGYQIIGVPATKLYAGMTKEQFLNYYCDIHMNKNGSALFTAAITPALIEAYEESPNGF